MIRFRTLIFSILILTVCNITNKTPVFVNGKFFEYDLPNRTVTICPTYSLISIECPQIVSNYPDQRQWQSTLPQYLISIDYIRSFPSRLGHDPSSCQPDFSHACDNYDLRYLNTLCNGKAHCPDIPTYQVRDRSLCAFKAVTEIGFHCVPTWHLREIQTKCDICKNGSLTNDYGFIYSRNYPLQTIRIPCFTTIYARPYHKTVLYFVNGELNHDQLRIESVSAEGLTILNVTLNGNISTQRLAMSNNEMKITFLPSHIYSHQATYYLLYFYTVPICSYTDPCLPIPPPTHPITTPIPTPTTTTSRIRIQSVGWTRVPNIWIIIPIILAYILLLLLIIVLALLFQRRRKQKKILTGLTASTISSRYLESSGTSSRAQLVTPLPPPNTGGGVRTRSLYRHTSTSHYPYSSPTFARNMERYHRESRSDFDLHQSALNGVDYRPETSTGYAHRTSMVNGVNRSYGTMENPSRHYSTDRRRSLPKSFSDCDLCKRQVYAEDFYDERDDNWRLENSIDRRLRPSNSAEPRAYREKIKERFRERLSVRQIPDVDPTTTVEYSTVLPRHQRIASESNRSMNGAVHHLPFEYIPNEPTSTNIRTVEYKRNANEEHLAVGTNDQQCNTDDCGTTNFTVKFYQRDDEDEEDLKRCLHEAREVQEMSMRMTEQQHQYVNRNQFSQQRRFHGNGEM